jgi:hypothetical protein
MLMNLFDLLFSQGVVTSKTSGVRISRNLHRLVASRLKRFYTSIMKQNSIEVGVINFSLAQISTA